MTGLLHALAARTLQQSPGVRSALAASSSNPVLADAGDAAAALPSAPADRSGGEPESNTTRPSGAQPGGGQAATAGGVAAGTAQSAPALRLDRDEPAPLVAGRGVESIDRTTVAIEPMPAPPAPSQARGRTDPPAHSAPRPLVAVRAEASKAPLGVPAMNDRPRAGELATARPGPTGATTLTEVHVHIGRVELTALTAAAPSRDHAPRAARATTSSLADYLKRGPGGRS